MKDLLRKLLNKSANSREILLSRQRKSPDGANTELLVDAPGLEKMSQVILEFAMPWLKDAADTEDAHGILALAMIAWNLSLLSAKDCEQQFETLLLPKLERPHQIMFRKMITRKRTLFPNKRRQILDYQLGRKGDQLTLDVVTTMEP